MSTSGIEGTRSEDEETCEVVEDEPAEVPAECEEVVALPTVEDEEDEAAVRTPDAARALPLLCSGSEDDMSVQVSVLFARGTFPFALWIALVDSREKKGALACRHVDKTMHNE